ncbi:MAG: hypothetical protein RMI88_04430 [Nitrososphaerota archaeon]|nr:hypothetical protein [Nitrososphaerota archaeon]
MRRRLTSEDIISTLFLDEGFYEVGRIYESIGIDSQLVFSNGKQEIIVNILNEDSCSSKSVIHEVLIEVEKLMTKFNGVVLAIPRKFSKTIDEGVLARHGIGLIIYDTMGAEELLPPKITEKKQKIEEMKLSENDVRLNEILLLRTEVSKIMKILEEFEARLDRLEREQKMISIKMSEIEKMMFSREIEIKKVEESKKSSFTHQVDDSLPSFLKDNPWVEILSKKV